MAFPDVPVLDEGPHHAVFDKPAGMVVVRARGVPGPTLLDVAEQRFGKGARPVHRLDRFTTGCCVIAKTPFGQAALSEAFRTRLVDKRYLALVEGACAWDRLDVDARLFRHNDPYAKKGPLAWQTVDERGQRALTRLWVLARGPTHTLVEARPETGRMHQIRVHLAHVGHPLVGDALYGSKETEGRPLLHAYALSFPAPSGGRRFVTAPLPRDLRKACEARGVALSRKEEERLFARFFASKAKAQTKVERKQPARKREAKKQGRRKGPSQGTLLPSPRGKGGSGSGSSGARQRSP